MVESFISFVPPYLAIGLFLSWIIWAFYFNEEKSFHLNGDVRNIMMILRIFLLFFVIAESYLFIFTFTILLFFIPDPSQAIETLNRFPQLLVALEGLALFMFVMFANEKQNIKKILAKYFYQLAFAALCIPIFYLAFVTALFFSPYKYLLLAKSIYMFAVALLFLVAIFTIMRRLLFEENEIESFKEFYKRNKMLLYTKAIPMLIAILVLFSLIFIWVFPSVESAKIENSRYIIFNKYHAYVEKTIQHQITDVGKSLGPIHISDWIPLDYDTIDLETIPEDLKKETVVEFNYTDNLDTVNLFSYSANPDEFFKGLRFIRKDNVSKKLLFQTQPRLLSSKNITSINLRGFLEISNTDLIEKFEKRSSLRQGNSTTFWYNFTNEFKDVPVILDEYPLENLRIWYDRDVYCTINNVEKPTIYDFNNQTKTYPKTNIICSEQRCDIESQNRGLNWRILIDQSNVLSLHFIRPVGFHRLMLSINLSC